MPKLINIHQQGLIVKELALPTSDTKPALIRHCYVSKELQACKGTGLIQSPAHHVFESFGLKNW
jgi:hypothetical protein